jgi:EpsI family protein
MKLPVKNLVLLALMLVSSALGTQLRLSISIADELPPIDLKTMVPTAFGNWRERLNFSNQIVNPEQKQMLEQMYSQTLSRSYVDPNGYVIMLSIAYGKNQKGKLQLHKPEVCYPAQGFALSSKQLDQIDLAGQTIAVTRLETSQGPRVEPLTYWSVVGEHITVSQNDKRLVEVGYALHGRIPDGMLVRISSLDKNTASAYAIQAQFANAMLQAIEPTTRSRFIGSAQHP